MSNDPFGVYESGKPVPKYAIHSIVKTDKGNWQQYDISLTPIEPEKPIKAYTKRSFSPDWKQVSAPSLKIIFDKIDDIPERYELMNKVFNEETPIKYYWEEYKDYDKAAIAKKKTDGYEKYIDIDSQGREYLKYLGIHYLEFFPDETSWRKAAESNEPTEQPLPVVETKSDNQGDAILAAIPAIVQSCGTDMKKLTETLSHPPFNSFKIDSPEIKDAVIVMIKDKSKDDVAQQVILLAEINSHFETVYIELTDLLNEGEVPF